MVAEAPPAVEYVLPANKGQDIAFDKPIEVVFKDSIKLGSGRIIISNGQGDIRRIAVHDSSQIEISSQNSKYGPFSNKLTIRPAQKLLSNSNYYIQVDDGAITSLGDIPLPGVTDPEAYSFKTSADNTPPFPISAEYRLSPTGDPIVKAVFNEPIKTSSALFAPPLAAVNDQNGDQRNMNIQIENNSAIFFTPHLKPNTQYSLSVSPNAISDLAGNGYAGVPETAPFVFKTGNEDVTPPQLAYSEPISESLTSVGTDIALFFDEFIKIGTGNITISNSQGDVRKIAITDANQVTFNNSVDNFNGNHPQSFTIRPSQPLLPNSHYVVQAEPGVVADLSGNKFAGLSDQLFSFSTLAADSSPPAPVNAIVEIDVRDTQRQHIPIIPMIQATFNETIKAGKGNFIISNGAGDSQTIPANDTRQISFSYESLQIRPAKKLLPGTRYYLLVDNGAITDINKNAYAGVSDKTAFTFTTEALWASSTHPVEEINQGTTVGRYENKDILKFNFNRPVKNYISFKLNQHSFGGNDVVLSQDGLSATVQLTDGSTVEPGDVLTLQGVNAASPDPNGMTPTANIEFTL